MATKTDILVYAHWIGMESPENIGTLSAHQSKGRKVFSFDYTKSWLESKAQFLLDPDIQWFGGTQFPDKKENFGVFMDSMPDTWGRRLMQRRAAQQAAVAGESSPNLYELDFLLGVNDFTRMGALRFKLDPEGSFLDNNKETPAPPLAHIRTLQESARIYEEDEDGTKGDQRLQMLIAPGSSLGGARPKANIQDTDGNLFIAKFPSKSDTTDKAAWEYLAYLLSKNAGIITPESQLLSVFGSYRTFLSKRFDRIGSERIHFASAMTMTGNNEDMIRDAPASYLDIAEFLQYNAKSSIEQNLHQLWRRIIFNMAISNTDDHLRNHGFLLDTSGWRLSPAYDINPSVDKAGLAINVDTHDNSLDFELARSVGEYFQLKDDGMTEIIKEVVTSVSNWKNIAKELGIPRSEQEIMAPAFALASNSRV